MPQNLRNLPLRLFILPAEIRQLHYDLVARDGSL